MYYYNLYQMKNLNTYLIYATFVSSLLLLVSPLRATTCANAIPITAFPVLNQALVCGTADNLSPTNVPAVCNNIPNTYKGGSEALYTFTPSSSGTYHISYYGKFLTSIFVYNGCPTAGGSCLQAVGSSPQYKALAVNLTGGVSYYIWFDVWTGSNGPCPATFSITSSMLNDNCSGAVVFPPFYLAATSVTASTLGATGTPDAACAGNEDDDVWFTFTTPPGITSLTYNTGNVINGNGNLVVQLFQGTCGNLTAIGCYDPESGAMNGLSGNTTYYLRAYTFGTGSNSTFDIRLTIPDPPENDNCSGALAFPPIPTNGDCSQMSVQTLNAGGTASDACIGEEDDDVWYTFTTPPGYTFVHYKMTNLTGSNDRVLEVFSGTCGGLTSIGCYDPEIGTITGLSVNTTYYLRAFTKGSNVGSLFLLCLDVRSPTNDFCSGAIAFPAFPADGSCAVVAVSTVNATGPFNDPTCTGEEDDDVWFSFTTPPGTTHLLYNNTNILNLITWRLQVLQGTCDGLTSIGCYFNDSGIITGLTGNTTYYLRAYTNSSEQSTFQICLRAPPTNDNCTQAIAFPPIPLENTCASVTASTVNAGNIGSPSACTGSSDDDVWFTFTTPNGVSKLLYNITNISGTDDMVLQVYTGTCTGLTSAGGCYDAESGTISGLSGNTTYYLRAYTYDLWAFSTFNICLRVPVQNDNCSEATAFPIISVNSSCSTVSGSTLNAIGSSTIDCGGIPDDDVWFSFITPVGATFLEYAITPVSGNEDLVIRLYQGSCNVALGCFDAENGAFSGLLANTLYNIQVFTKEAGVHSVFDICLRTPPQLVNNNCQGAIPIPSLPLDGSCMITTISTLGATGVPNASCVGTEDDDIWYTFTTPPGQSVVRYSMTNISGSSDRVLQVYQGNCPGSINSVGCYDPEIGFFTGLTSNTTYFLKVYTSAAGAFSVFNLCLSVQLPPLNDNCSGAFTFPELPLDGSCATVTVTTAGATGVTSSTCIGAEDDDVWYTFTTPSGVASVLYDFVSISGNDSRAFQVFQGTCSGLASIGCYNPALGGFISGLSGNTTYYLRVYTQPSGVVASTFQLCLRLMPPPPPNDHCLGAITFPDILPDGIGATVTFTTFGATGIPDDNCQGVEDDDVWLTFTVPPGVTTLLYNYTLIAGNNESHFQLYKGDCDTLALVGCHYNLKSGYIKGLSNNTTYYIRAYTKLANVAGTFQLMLRAAAANDECSNAIPFPDFPSDDCSQVVFSLSHASPSTVANGLVCSITYTEDLWYSFSLPSGVTYLHYEMNGEYPSNPRFQLFSGECSNLISLGCFDPGDGVISGLSSGVVYYLRAFEFDTYFNNLSICLWIPPSNDACSGAIAFPAIPADGSCASVAVNTSGATGTNDPTCSGEEDDDLWYTFTTPPGVTTLFYSYSNLVTSDNNIYFQLFSGNSCSELTSIGCFQNNNKTLSGLSENTVYHMRVYTNSGGNATFDMCLRGPATNDACTGAIAFPDLPTNGSCAMVTASTNFATGTQDPTCTGNEADDVWYTFTTPPGLSVISYEMQTISGSSDRELQIFSGECGNLTPIGCYDPESGILTGLASNTTYYLRAYTWYDNVSSTFSLCLRVQLFNDNCDQASVFPNIAIDGSCAIVTASTTYATGTLDPTCTGGEDDDVWFTFTTPPGISALGYENTTISGNTNRVLQIFSGECGSLNSIGCYDPENGTITGLNGNTTYYLRAYTSSSDERAVFNICLRVPAFNDECSGAIAFPAIPADGSCAILNISTKFATGSPDPTCAGTEDDDVWYTFTTPSGVTRLVYQGYETLNDVNFQYFSGSCGSLTSIGCFNFTSNSGIITGLTGNTTYYLRAYTSSTGVSRSGDFCLRLLLTNDNCSGAISFPTIPLDGSCATVSASATGATGSPDPTCVGVEDDDIWYTFTTPPGVTTLWYEITSTPFNEYKVLEIFSGSCNNRISIGCYAPLTPAKGHITGLTGNTTYYMRAYSNASTTSVPAFDICLRVPPPNDDCPNAIAFPDLPLDGSCVEMNISTRYASPSEPTACMGANNKDVWYTFTTPPGIEAVHYQTTGITGNDIKLEVLSGSCGNLTPIGCYNSNEGSGVFIGLAGGTTYYLRAHTTSLNIGDVFSICLQPTPVNDFCQYATAFPDIPADGSCATIIAHTGKAGGTEGFTCDDWGSEEADVWFTFTTPPNVTYLRYEIRYVSGNAYWGMQILSGSCSNLAPLGCYLGDSGFITGLTGNTTYYLRAYSTSTSDNAAFSICLNLPLPNDNCAGATLIGSCNTSINGSFYGASADGLSSGCVVNVSPETKGLWYRIVGDGLPLMLHTCLGSEAEAGIIVYSGSCGSQVCITGNQGACSSGSQVSWVTTAGQDYYVFVYPVGSIDYDDTFTLSIIGGVQCPSVIGQTTVSIDTLNTGATISWPATAGIAHYDYILSTDGSCSTGTMETTTNNSISFSGLEPDTEYTFCIRSNCSCSETNFSSITFSTPPCEEPLGTPWTTTDIGGAQGTAINNYCGGSIDISSDGPSPSGSNDQQFFASQNFCDSLTITTKVNSIANGGFAGIAFRESAAPGSRMVALKIKKGKYVYREVRSATNGAKSTQQFFTTGHKWLRIVRNADSFIGYSSSDGINWLQHFSINLAMPSCTDAGLFVESTHPDSLATGAFSNVSMLPSTSTVATPGGDVPTGDLPTGDGTSGYVIYPNPTQALINVEMDKTFLGKALTITINNQFGQMMTIRKIDEVQDPIETFKVQHLPPGVYIMILRTDGGEAFAKKFVVVR